MKRLNVRQYLIWRIHCFTHDGLYGESSHRFSSFCQNKIRNDMILCENRNAVQTVRHGIKIEDDMLLNITYNSNAEA